MSDNSEDDDFAAPNPRTDWDNDDDEPPAAGACLIISESGNPEAWISMAPTAEPKHRANPDQVITA